MVSVTTIELKFLLKLIGRPDYRGKVVALSPSSKTSAAERDRICESLGSKGLVEYDSEISKFAIAPPGKALLGLDTTSLPVTPDELIVLKACKGTTTPGKISSKIPAGDRQNLIRSLADRGMLKISKITIKEVWLSAQGKQFLLNEYKPSGNSLVATATTLGHYVRFLRDNIGKAPRDKAPDQRLEKSSDQVFPSSQPQPQQPLSQPGNQPASAIPIGSGTQPDKHAVLHQIRQLDPLFGDKNYLPIFHLRDKLQPPLTRSELDNLLYTLQKEGQIELDSLHDQGQYTQAQMSAGIRQDNGGYLFFISVL